MRAGSYVSLTVFFAVAITANAAPKPTASAFERTLNVCVMNDVLYPVSAGIMKKITRRSFAEYQREVGIRFVPMYGTFMGDLNGTREKLQEYFPTTCGGKANAWIIFTTAILVAKVSSEGLVATEGVQTALGGISDAEMSYIALFDLANQFKAKDKGGNNACTTLLNHEIGHWFYLKHTEDVQGFMYKDPPNSMGRWTQQIKDDIKVNFYRPF